MRNLYERGAAVYRAMMARYGHWAAFRVVVYPVTLLLVTPYRFLQTMSSAVRAFSGCSAWGAYPSFQQYRAFNDLFYYNQALNMRRYGRYGTSPLLGLGRFRLSANIQYSLVSLFSFWKLGSGFVLLCMLGWVAMHMLWSLQSPVGWVTAVSVMLAVSTSFYANAFGHQKYEALGWLWFPLSMYGILTGDVVIAAAGMILVSFGGIVCTVLVGYTVLLYISTTADFMMAASVGPAALLIALRFVPLFKKDGGTVMSKLVRMIGLTDRKTRYRRMSTKKFSPTSMYFLLLYIQFAVCLMPVDPRGALWVVGGIILSAVNTRLFRFSDPQYIQIMMVSLGTALVMLNPNVWLLIPYWLLVSPMPYFAYFPGMDSVLDVVPALEPYDVRPVLARLGRFLDPVAGQGHETRRVLMAFSDPGDVYEQIFDGYRVLIEPLAYAAATKNIHYLPDWSSVFETNYPGAEDIWGREPGHVLKNAARLGAGFVIVYQQCGTELDPAWQGAGFRIAGHFSWNDPDMMVPGTHLYSGPIPDWWLLEVPDRFPAGKLAKWASYASRSSCG